MTARVWLQEFLRVLAGPAAPQGRPLHDFTRFDIGVCPGCRGVRAIASVRCFACGSEAPVIADA